MKRKGTNTFVFFLAGLVLLLIHEPLFSQSNRYVIITFEWTNSFFPYEVSYHWITKVDNIQVGEVDIYPLFLDLSGEIKQEEIKDLKKLVFYPEGEDIPLLNEDDDFNGGKFRSVDYEPNIVGRLLLLIEKNKTLIQTSKNKWPWRHYRNKEDRRHKHKAFFQYNEIIRIYATPVMGYFDEGWEYCVRNGKLEFSCKSCFPISEVIYDRSFWEKEAARILVYNNYSHVEFNKSTLKCHW